jgi:hypothetical protein
MSTQDSSNIFRFDDDDDDDDDLTKADREDREKTETESVIITGESYKKRKCDEVDISSTIRKFLEIPEILLSLFNAGNIDTLGVVINKFFDENCSFQSSRMMTEEFGRNHVIQYFCSISQASPDILIVLKSQLYDKDLGIIKVSTFSTGTRQFDATSDYLYSLARDSSSSAMDSELREEVLNMENTFGQFAIQEKSRWLMILNADMNRIKKFIVTQKVLNVSKIY